MTKKEDNKIRIRNSTTDFLVFSRENGGDAVDVLVADENVWLTQKSLCSLYVASKSAVSEHLQAIIAVGIKVNSEKTVRFRSWAADVLADFATKDYVLDKERLKNDRLFSRTCFEHLLEDIRETVANLVLATCNA